jgi:hypothetical protein
MLIYAIPPPPPLHSFTQSHNIYLFVFVNTFSFFLSFFPSAKLSYFPEVKLGVNIPARGESQDLLNVDGDKNDCEWYAH